MAVVIAGTTTAYVSNEVDANRSIIITSRPTSYAGRGHYRASLNTGTLTAGQLANVEFSIMRFALNTGIFGLVHEVAISGALNVAAGAASLMGFKAYVNRGYQTSPSGGGVASIIVNFNKMRTSMFSPTMQNMRISTTGSLTTGTRSQDAQGYATPMLGILTGAITTQCYNNELIPRMILFNSGDEGGKHPIVLGINEGISVANNTAAWPTLATWMLNVSIAWSEAVGY